MSREPPPLSRGAVRQLLHLGLADASRARQREQTERHRLTMAHEASVARGALRSALRFVRDHAHHAPEAAAAVLDHVRRLHPGFLEPAFLDFQKPGSPAP